VLNDCSDEFRGSPSTILDGDGTLVLLR